MPGLFICCSACYGKHSARLPHFRKRKMVDNRRLSTIYERKTDSDHGLNLGKVALYQLKYFRNIVLRIGQDNYPPRLRPETCVSGLQI